MTCFLGDDGALVFGRELGCQLGDEFTDLLWVEITVFLRNIHQGHESLIVTLLWSFLESTACTTDLYRKFLTASISYKLAR